MSRAPDVAIIGGGLLGWSVAYRLSKAGVSTLVIDREDEGFATQAGAGIIAPGASFRASDKLFDLSCAAMRYYPDLIEELKSDAVLDTGYAAVGALFIARTDDEADTLPVALETIAQRRSAGMGNIGQLSLVTGPEAQSLFPPLAPIPGAIHLTGAARVDGRKLLRALMTASKQHSVEVRPGSASIGVRDGKASLTIDNTPLIVGTIVIAGGAWSGTLGAQIGINIPVYPQRGQIIHVRMDDDDTSGWPIIEGYVSHYILTFGPDRVVFGATREHDSGYAVNATAGGIKQVLDNALSVAPGLAPAVLSEIRIGLRPFSPDELPILGSAPGIDNLFICTGHGPSGLTLGPYSGAAVAQVIQGQIPEVDLGPFSVSRFQ